MRLMMDYPWPGNVRELEHAVEHGIICANGNQVDEESLPQDIRDFQKNSNSIRNTFREKKLEEDEFRKEIEGILKQCDGNKAKTAQMLGIDRSTLWRRMEKFKMNS